MSESSTTAEILDEIGDIDLGILVFDGENRLRMRNKAAQRMLVEGDRPLSDEEVPRLFFDESPAPAEAARSRGRRTLKLGKTVCGYSVYRLSGGRRCVLIQDITERLRLEALAEALESTKNLAFHFSSVRHELANPIHGIKIAASYLRDHLDRFQRDTYVDYLNRILSEVGRVEYLLNSLKTFSLLDELHIEAIDAANFLARFIVLIRDGFSSRGIHVATDLDPSVETFHADGRAMHQILLNLLANAADALEGRSDPRIEIHVDRAEDQVRIAVSDNGCGIEEERLEQVFQPFFTLKQGGTGLGLAIVRRLVMAMGGRIEIESHVGLGTVVRILLPETGVAESMREAQLLRADRAPHPVWKPEPEQEPGGP